MKENGPFQGSGFVLRAIELSVEWTKTSLYQDHFEFLSQAVSLNMMFATVTAHFRATEKSTNGTGFLFFRFQL
jgi:hypothetical protein